MRLLTILTFYHPHWTGLTAIAKSIAEGLAERGHSVTVLTTRHRPDLPREEVLNGVRIVRLQPVGRFSRGLIAPSFPAAVARLIRGHDVVQIHTPLMECVLVATLCRLYKRPLLMTHQGDLVMPAGVGNQAIQRLGVAMLRETERLATAISAHSSDYVSHSSFLRPFADKIVPIYPPVEIPQPRRDAAASWRRELGLEARQLIGFAGRFVEEKGFDYLLQALPMLLDSDRDVQLVYAGEHQVAYEDFYERCRPLVEACGDRLTLVGLLLDRQGLANFYAMCDVFSVPSRTDMFATVQVEAMLCGTPVVATDIPGAREPVRVTGMGLLVEPRNPRALAEGLTSVLRNRERYLRSRDEIRAAFDPVRSIDAYESVLASLASTG
jgi:glycosyltransferase involved in cell wall biosynthesis